MISVAADVATMLVKGGGVMVVVMVSPRWFRRSQSLTIKRFSDLRKIRICLVLSYQPSSSGIGIILFLL